MFCAQQRLQTRQQHELEKHAWPDPGLSIFGAVYGALLVNYAKSILSESFPELWLFAMGGLFIAVVMAFPNGLAGIWKSHVEPVLPRLTRRLRPARAAVSPAEAAAE